MMRCAILIMAAVLMQIDPAMGKKPHREQRQREIEEILASMVANQMEALSTPLYSKHFWKSIGQNENAGHIKLTPSPNPMWITNSARKNHGKFVFNSIKASIEITDKQLVAKCRRGKGSLTVSVGGNLIAPVSCIPSGLKKQGGKLICQPDRCVPFEDEEMDCRSEFKELKLFDALCRFTQSHFKEVLEDRITDFDVKEKLFKAFWVPGRQKKGKPGKEKPSDPEYEWISSMDPDDD